jgi:hypothetical protein
MNGVCIFARVHEWRNKLVRRCWYPTNWILYYTQAVTEETKSTHSMGGWLHGSYYQELLEVSGNSPLMYMQRGGLVRCSTRTTMPSNLEVARGRWWHVRKGSSLSLFFLCLLSLNLFLDDWGGNDARKGKVTSVRYTWGMPHGPLKIEQQKVRVEKTASKARPFHPQSPPYGTRFRTIHISPHLPPMPHKTCTITASRQGDRTSERLPTT